MIVKIGFLVHGCQILETYLLNLIFANASSFFDHCLKLRPLHHAMTRLKRSVCDYSLDVTVIRLMRPHFGCWGQD